MSASIQQELERMKRRVAYLEGEIARIERAFEREQENLAKCKCGAWRYSKKAGQFVQVADCCCGEA